VEKTYNNILLVEDDTRLADLVSSYLNKHNMNTDIVNSGEEALDRLRSSPPDLVILDITLPGMDGFDVCRRLRHFYNGPVIILTARDEDVDQVVGLELGADDYIVKPVDPRVLLARIRARLRRNAEQADMQGISEIESDKSRLEFGRFCIDKSSRVVRLGDNEIVLMTNEFDLLWFFACNRGKVLGRDDIMKEIRGIPFDGLDRSVDIWISRLRKKIEDDPVRPQHIKTVWGKGYLFVT